MGLESATYVSQLDSANPLGSDQKLQGDDHLRLIKAVLQSSFPNSSKAFYIPATQAIAFGDTPYSVVAGDQGSVLLVDASGGAVTIDLIAAATATDGYILGIKKIDSSANVVTVDGNGAETIDGAATLLLSDQYQSAILIVDASAWHVHSRSHDLLVLDNTFSGANTFSGINTFSAQVRWAKGGDITSAATLVLGTDGNAFDVDGATGPITSITVAAGTWFLLQFDSTPTLNYHATNLILNTDGANYTAAAGDLFLGYAYAEDQVRGAFLPISGKAIKGSVLQTVHTETGAVATGTAFFPQDDTIPQSGEGDEYMTRTITPLFSTSTLLIEVVLYAGHTVGDPIQAALFKDSEAGALAVGAGDHNKGAASGLAQVAFRHEISAGGVAEQTFKVRAGSNQAGTFTFNGRASARLFGGALASSIRITEYAA